MGWEKTLKQQGAATREGLQAAFRRFDKIDEAITEMEKRLMSVVDDLYQAVAKNRSVTESAVELLTQLHSKLSAAASNADLDKVKEILSEVNADTERLASAVAANTIAMEPPVPPTSPEPPTPAPADPVSLPTPNDPPADPQ
jgi:uncharacterized protein YpuA (DUF1002 family)